jgi:peroxiredoxin
VVSTANPSGAEVAPTKETVRKMRQLLPIAAALLFAACGPALTAAPAPQPVPAGEPDGDAPAATADDGGGVADFTLKDVHGKSHSLSEHLGSKVILLSFWATWCEPCKKEMVQLEELFTAHKDRGLMILSISMDEPETQGDARTYATQRRFTFPVLLDTESQVTGQFNPRRAAPYNLVIDRRRRIAWTHEGYVPGDEKTLEQAVLDALAAE